MESFSLMKVVAVVLIFGGVYLVTISKDRQAIEKYEAARRAGHGE